MKILIFLACLMGGCLQASDYENEKGNDNFFDSIQKGYWVSEESIIDGNKSLFNRFCQMNNMSFCRFKEIILDKKLMEGEKMIRAIAQKNPSLLRPYTQEERDAIFIYLNGYESLLIQYAQDMKDDIEKQELNNVYFEKFRSVVIGILGGIISGSFKGAVLIALCNEIIVYMVDYGTDWPFLNKYKDQADWQYLFYRRIETAQEAQILNLRRI